MLILFNGNENKIFSYSATETIFPSPFVSIPFLRLAHSTLPGTVRFSESVLSDQIILIVNGSQSSAVQTPLELLPLSASAPAANP